MVTHVESLGEAYKFSTFAGLPAALYGTGKIAVGGDIFVGWMSLDASANIFALRSACSQAILLE